MPNAYIYAGKRSAFARHGGALAEIRPDDLAATVIKGLVDATGIDTSQIEEVILGCTNQAGEDSRNVARHASLLAGLPITVAAQTVNRLCASGLAAIMDASRAIRLAEGNIYIAGGVESMSRAPYVMSKASHAYARDVQMFDSTIGARFANPQLITSYGNHSMPETADHLARLYNIARADADAFALQSQHRYQHAWQNGFFNDEIIAIETQKHKKSPSIIFQHDEHPRANSTLNDLTRLQPLFADGIVTAGNASGINDGAVAVLLGDEDLQLQLGHAPLARIVATASSGVMPDVMGIGPVSAIEKLLQRTGVNLCEIDLIEINEAFAPQVLACLKGLDLAFDDPRVNPYGGAIALGHPLGASGARLALSASRYLQQQQKRYAIVSLCIGVGQGLAMLLENPVFNSESSGFVH